VGSRSASPSAAIFFVMEVPPGSAAAAPSGPRGRTIAPGQSATQGGGCKRMDAAAGGEDGGQGRSAASNAPGIARGAPEEPGPPGAPPTPALTDRDGPVTARGLTGSHSGP
jgi:hypothetical protein